MLLNHIEYILEVNMDMDETHPPRSIKTTGIQRRIPTIMLLKQEMNGSALISI